MSATRTDTIQKLRYLLSISKCNHKMEIMKQPDIKHAHLYCKIHQLSGQISGPLIEYYIANAFQMVKNNASLCIGDLCHKETNIEIKVSMGGKDNRHFNYVQLRMNHHCQYLLTAYYIDDSNVDELGELYLFRLEKKDIKPIIVKYGGYAHGTIQKLGPITAEDLDKDANDKEYAIRPIYGDKCWKELLSFRVNEVDI